MAYRTKIEVRTFKFQSDSINTLQSTLSFNARLHLNSNLILLIPLVDRVRAIPLNGFKFQSDSINTGAVRITENDLLKRFKFQSDSINTGI